MSLQTLGALLGSRRWETSVSATEWEALVDRARHERVAPILARAVHDAGGVPAAVRDELARDLYNTGASNLVLYRELARMLDAGERRAIVLKGGALAATVYDDVALRPMSDLDVLVRKDDLPYWKSLLTRLGYEPAAPEMTRGLAQAVHYQLAFRGGTTGDVVIELHWNLVAGESDWRAPDIEWFWRQSEPWPGIDDLACPPALQLTPVANVLYLSAHALLQHGGARTRLLWLYDVHLVVERAADALGWDDVIAGARTLRWDAAVKSALEQCRELFGTRVPDAVVDALSSGVSPEAEDHVHRKASVEASRAELVWREFLCLDAPGRMRLLLAILFPSPAYVKWRYPRARALWPLAYVYRWSVVAREGAAYTARVLTTALSFVSL